MPKPPERETRKAPIEKLRDLLHQPRMAGGRNKARVFGRHWDDGGAERLRDDS